MQGLVSLVFLKASAFSWGSHHWTLLGFRPAETQVKEGGREKVTRTTSMPTGHPPGTVVPEPVLVKALKNWKQTHRRESVTGGAQSRALALDEAVFQTQLLKRGDSGLIASLP